MEKTEKRRGRKRTKAEADEEEGIVTDIFSHDTSSSSKKPGGSSAACMNWTEAEYVSEKTKIDKKYVESSIKLFRDENTIPFIARYRKSITGGLDAEQLRIMKECYDLAIKIRHRASVIINAIKKQGKWSADIDTIVRSTKSLSDLEHIYSTFKTPSKRTLAERARELGLEPVAKSILQGCNLPDISSLINKNKAGLKTKNEIEENIIYIIADIISKDKTVFEKIRYLRKSTIINIETCRGKCAKEKKVCSGHSANTKNNNNSQMDEKKFEMYYQFKSSENHIKPHQILAINRGEAHKFLLVKIIIPELFERALKDHVLNLYAKAIRTLKVHSNLIELAFDHSYKKSIKPAIMRRFRNEMSEKARAASVQVFANNLKQLILTPPFKGCPILGIDPGFFHGCKLAMISENGDVLQTSTIYPHLKRETSRKAAIEIIKNLIRTYSCTTIALGNGTACRETEVFLANLIKEKVFGNLRVLYTIVNEAGASIYSCNNEAKKEFPDMDPNVISAISIARRLQDPLAELVKVEPKHLGVGMYQHDLQEKQLDLTLNEVVTEAVSFVGVDVNTASHCLLKKIAGLNAIRATNIIDWRKKNGPLINREQLLNIKGIGKKIYEQCAGFIRISPETALISSEDTSEMRKLMNYLDQTWIHPECYKIAERLIELSECCLDDLGTPSFIDAINAFVKQQGYTRLADKFKTDVQTVEIIVTGLTVCKEYDIRLNRDNKPFFRKGLTEIDNLSSGVLLNGIVRNVTEFGVFVDVGVCRDGLIPSRFMKGQILNIGQQIEVRVLNVEKERNRFSIELIRIL